MPDQLALLVQAGHPLISIESSDEVRALELIRKTASKLDQSVFTWSMTEGLIKEPGYGTSGATLRSEKILGPGKAQDLLLHLIKNPKQGLYVFKDLGPHCKEAVVHRLMRDFLAIADEGNMAAVMVDLLPIPEEMRSLTFRYELGWPSSEELEEVVTQTFQKVRRESNKDVTSQIRRKEMDQIVQGLRGLSCCQAARVISSAIYDDHRLDGSDLSRIIEGKRQLLSSSGCLESIAADFSVEDIGGLDNLKRWLKQRRGGFTKQALETGLESPRGVLMLGVPGCGKSLCAKVVAADWGMPLLRMDPGVLYQKYIGASENQLRQALRQAEAMAPVVLWIDEIEKAFASANTSSADGGLSKRMFGTLLSWMQDHRHPIFIVATANDISALPPELMRKGRFDEVFFVDLPSDSTKAQVLGIHLKRRGQDPERFKLDEHASMAKDFSGSEIEQAVVSALYAAYDDKKPLADHHIAEEISKTRPLATLSAESIIRLRSWAEHRCVAAD